ncbi:MAG TPA: DNA polymerase III subunit beta [Chloroflexota bacterium]|nr:DNA polymerase III subunit beta [Chloroflexota bacterium]
MSIVERDLERPAAAVVERTGSAMRISCAQEQLSRGLAIVGRAVGGRTTLPVLNNVLLASDGERLKLSATNLEIGITTWVPGTVEGEGQLTVPARLLADFVNSLPAGQFVLLDANPRTHTLHLECARYNANIKGIDPEEFPPIPAADDRPTIKLGAGLLKEMISQVAFSAARDESRPVLAGVNLRLDETRLVLSAADGFRLAKREAALEQGLPEKLDIIIPARALTELARLLDDGDEDVEVTVTPNRSQVVCRVRATGGEVILVSRLLEGQFPDLERVIPKTHTTKVTLKRNDFVTATRIAALFARDAANVVKLDVTPGEEGGLTPGSVALSANALEVGDNRGEIDAAVEGEGTYISFSSEYLADVLGVLTSDEITVQITGPLSPAVVRGVDQPDYTHVIMPMHTVR